MDMKAFGEKTTQLIRKFKYPILVVIVGIAMMLIPFGNNGRTAQVTDKPIQSTSACKDITEELTGILSNMDGVGKVSVMLTIQTGEQVVYQQDEDISTTENGSAIRKETVIITGTDRNQQPLIQYTKPPVYLGAIIVCQGAEQPSVKLAILDAVSKITGLSTDKISVVKMK